MNPQPFVVKPDEYARGLNVVGETITVLASHDATWGYEIFMQQGPEGSGPPPHSHDWDESFFVIKGSVEVTCNDQTSHATPGTLVHVPAGTTHSFRMGPGGCEMLSVAGHTSRASALFTMIDQEVPPGPPDIAKLLEIAAKCNVHVGE
ncbi:MAG TPA: cupin domain-containing protein [Paraburkholderia sp.]|jgi:mannose-6-phosphate isomerase-like protein (cupin superfamily)|uniref:cupin domain-containing protein n=1 Tax=Paraburkholderia sp. TaxID=1926495 RepID=UPI002B495B63|nr:cupin domain-containing protein [Paraburkholderia sp.]HKR41887.1 cupin domain-containing protein [Paraburkholderia sp.]